MLMPSKGYNSSGSTKIINSVRRSRNWSRTSRLKISLTLDQFIVLCGYLLAAWIAG